MSNQRRPYLDGFRGKIVTWEQASEMMVYWRSQKRVVGFTNGCFDLIHPGHIHSLTEAAMRCDNLVVGLNGDASITRLKGVGRPVQTANARATVLAALQAVDMVVVFEEDTPARLIEALLPDVLFKGSDYTVEQIAGAAAVIANGGRVDLLPLVPGHSTTALVARSRI